ncbi:MAG: NAD(P)-binding protein [Chloroflexota bacterium]
MEKKKEKIAILGGGLSSITTAFELSSVPNWQEKYEITVYQMGWRLGGKGASGRKQSVFNRVEEHGLHIWFGFYHNAFDMIRRAYLELDRPLEKPLATWEEAFKPLNLNTLEEKVDDEWMHWLINFPTNNEMPGEGGELLSLQDYLSVATQFVNEILREGLYNREKGFTRYGCLGAILVVFAIGLELSFLKLLLNIVHVFSKVDHWLHRIFHLPFRHRVISKTLSHIIKRLRQRLEDTLEEDTDTRRLFVSVDFAIANIRGAIEDNLIENGFDSIDHMEYRDWLKKHGATDLTLQSVIPKYLYDLAFAYEDGDMSRPAFAAGVAFHCLLRAFFTFKGNYMYRMQAGMGDTIFTPLYLIMKERGVKFEFFHKVKSLEMSDDKNEIAQIIIERQATVTQEQEAKGGYDPLILVKDLECWPAEPLYDQLVEKEQLKEKIEVAGQMIPKYNLESNWTPWQGGKTITLNAGEDFDRVVLGISLPALPSICKSIFEAKPAWHNMITKNNTIQTQAFQLWFRPDVAGLGWPFWRDEPPIMSEYDVELPLEQSGMNTWADMTQVLIRECWPDEHFPNQITYFCGPLKGPGLENLPPEDDYEFPHKQFARVKKITSLMLKGHMKHLWPNAIKPMEGYPDALNWDLLVDAENREGEERLNSQFWRANIDPTERYVLSVPNGTAARLRTEQSGFHNMYLTGDWIYNGLNVGCVESAVMSGMLTSQAITTAVFGEPTPKHIVGGIDWWKQKKH